ncbi:MULTISPECIES: type III glutamate--ammonia ligase [Methylovorus]|jgi:glutamine synthetase|uniref:Glutamine synthetase, type III n=1 Tax=Methylovorus glucosotrophus (strain SIP3-4) TaxID=582744 RepID=C6XAC0_METGS|nr:MULTISPECIES: type III glutamate--ammonia ligase [Methylovorus]HWU34928.1 type III glutamate--ammonia ligase [Methylovorus sp.]ACT51661.1 glutamine synthetase, type III [Methylovorus glucosotrophus SIP3-4]ADQ85510.1 glutamine synthetase, type III [Methylovorus sp. MP688]KAF0843078.1 gamma-glutamylmethylamide synthetase [Methylovorus glucosotrophus]MCB4810839.1 type III glutamate--ammonia ligase [Methylovorus menthalis]
MKSLEEAQKFLEDHHVKYVLAQFVDIHGVAKVKSVPASHLNDILTTGAGFAGGAIWGTGIAPNGPDYMAIGELSTLSLIPWQPGYARLVCDGHVNGKPYEFDTRVVLKQQIARLAEKGWTLYTGLEPEFSLLKKDEHGAVHPFDDSDTLQKPCYDYKGITRHSPFLEKLTESLVEVGLDIYQIDHEDANGQFEINYTYADCLKSADDYIMFKMAASEIANELGIICSFMPKPFSNRPGNGMHMHMSIGDGKKSLFQDDSDPSGLGLSKLAYHFLGGILAHAPALAAVCAPTVNSYKRLVVGRSLSGATWAPAYIAYGNNNRSTLVRIPYGRLELRLPDGSCNPYLATAAVIAAGLDGVARELDPGTGRDDNLYDYSLEQLAEFGINILPQNLGEALDALEADQVIMDAMGPGLSKEFVELKRMEWVDYMRHVSDWEINRYVQFY